MERLNFKDWLEMMGATDAVYRPQNKSRDWNWQGVPGATGVTPKENPIKHWVKKKSKKKK